MMELDSPSLLKAVFESTADGLLIVGIDGKVIQYNNRFAEMWKIPQELLETKDDKLLLEFILSQLISPEEFLTKVREIYKEPDTLSNDTINFEDGRCFERFSRPLKVGAVTKGRVWSFRDVTTQRKNQEFFSSITALSPDIVSLIDASGKLVYNSQAAQRIHGYGPDELLGRNTFELIHAEDQSAVAEAMAQVLAAPGAIHSVQYRYRNRDGSWAWMEAMASNQIHNSAIKGLVTISREIGKRKEMEEEMNRTLQERDEFMSIASHELKTPVSSMLLQLQMLQRYKKKLKTGTEVSSRSEDLDSLVEQVQSLQRLIDDLLSVSRMRTGKLSLEFETLDLSQLVRASVERFRAIFSEANCTLEADIDNDIYFSCDRTRINQVLFNLMSNAVKYAPGTLVEVCLKRHPDYIEFRIRDHGHGIAEEKKESIFGLFERGSSQNYVTGLGIGLYIARSIVEGHNGSIHVESGIMKGATFIIRLPLI